MLVFPTGLPKATTYIGTPAEPAQPAFLSPMAGRWSITSPMSIKDEVRKRGLQLLGDPRVAKLMQNEQFMRAMMTVIQVPGKVEHFTSEQTERFAKMMRVATADEVKDLRRQVKTLEAEVAKLKKKIDS